MNKFQRSVAVGLVTLISAAWSVNASAAWTFGNSGGGDGFLTGSFPNFTIDGADNSAGSTTASYTQTFAAPTTITFDWVYKTFDCCGGVWDPAGYVLNGVTTQLSLDLGVGVGSSGTGVSVSVGAGDTFGWYVSSPDSRLGRGELTISAVPEPETYALLLGGLAIVGMAARRRFAGSAAV